jgi:hypothetical protein
MADKKISALPSATTPLAGTEVLPVVQSLTTDQVSVANLTAGRTVEMLNGILKTTVDVAGATTTYTMGACPSVPTGGALIKSVRTTTSGANHEVIIANVRSGVMNDNFKVDENGNIVALLGNLVIGTSGKSVTLPGGIIWTSGSGSPEGVVTAPVGSLYSRSDGGLLTSLYVKESGSGNTGWIGK